MKNVPKIIYLQTNCDEVVDFNDLIEATWCSESIYKSDLKFVSVDFLSSRLEETVKELKAIEGNSMASGQQRIKLIAIKKELKNLIEL